MKKITLSYTSYKSAVKKAFTASCLNPTVFYNPVNGFYVRPSKNLVPTDDTEIGLAFYNLNTNRPSMRGTRREYQPIMRAIKKFFSPTFVREEIYTAPRDMICSGSLPSGAPCREYVYDDTPCKICGHVTPLKKFRHVITLQELIEKEKINVNCCVIMR